MIARFRRLQSEYPPQFWLMFWGMLISTIGSSMVWPFMMIYVSEKLALPLSTVTSLMTVNATTGLIFAFIAGPVADRVGRKRIMVISLVADGLAFFLLSQASTYLAFMALMALRGAINPLYRVGADAMMADLVEPEKRPEAYSLLRMSNNAGIALGPSIGGFIAGVSYTLAFTAAAIGMTTYGVLMFIRARETLPQSAAPRQKERFGGYNHVLRDRPYIQFVLSFLLNTVVAAMVWVLLSVYAKQNFNVPESQYGFIATTNALMVVFLQFFVTRRTKRFPTLPVMA
ncbi:MFS transporter, partial [bacterium]